MSVCVLGGSELDSYSSSLFRPQQWFHSPVWFAIPDSSYQQSISPYVTHRPPRLSCKHDPLEMQTSINMSANVIEGIFIYLCEIFDVVWFCFHSNGCNALSPISSLAGHSL